MLAEKAAPDDPEVFVLRAQALTRLNKYEEAVKALRWALELKPEDPALHYQLGQLYRKQGQDELAKQEFERTRFLRSDEP
jgi:Flp pilus assembly protein TadD